jgi:cytochrome c biogenesis protein CcdA/thiol-disulfide isomerase/thioredoxin
MALLMVFGFVAGAATALSPCVLPVLPVVLAAGATGGPRRPLGIVTGLVVAFTFATVALVYVIAALGLPDELVRGLAIAVLGGFGVALILPRIAARLETAIGRLVPYRAAARRGDGFGSGVLLGAGLGLVYAPCAGPILAGVITVSASQEFTAGRLAVALSYGAGTAVVLYALMLGGRRLTVPLARRSALVQPAMGAVMVTLAVLMAAELDIRFQAEIADNLPAVLVNPSKALEESSGAQGRLAELRGGRGGTVAQAAERAGGRAADLPVLARAPEITGTQRWFNTRGGRPLALAGLRGRVVLVDFWTYSCINCLRTLPYLRAWDARYRRAGLTIVGVHAPEFPFERDAGNVARAVRANRLRYPVAQDNDFATWDAYGNRFWPAKYLIDARGRVRYTHFGEGAYAGTERAIRALLREAGRGRLGAGARARTDGALPGATPETYLGADRAERVVRGAAAADPPLHHVGMQGRWRVEPDRAVAERGARLNLRFAAQRVYLVLGSHGGLRRVRILLDGRRRRTVRVRSHRLYELVRLARAGTHVLTLKPDPGTEAYAFTFG